MKYLFKSNHSSDQLTIVNKSILSNKNKKLLLNPHLNEEILFSNKSQKEILLSLIKNTQIKLISEINNIKKVKKEKIIIFKNILNELKLGLSYILNEKKIKMEYLEDIFNKNKKEVQNEIINNNKNKNYKDENNYYAETEMIEKNYVGNELSKLKMQHFIIENEIIKTDFLIQYKKDITRFLKITNIFPEDNRELFLYDKIENEKIVDDIYNIKIKNEKEKLNEVFLKYKIVNRMIDEHKNKINNIILNIKTRKKFDSSDIIYEDSLESKIMSNSHRFNNSSSYNSNINDTYKLSNEISKDINLSNNESGDISKIKKNKYSNFFNLNMNINFNINIK